MKILPKYYFVRSDNYLGGIVARSHENAIRGWEKVSGEKVLLISESNWLKGRDK